MAIWNWFQRTADKIEAMEWSPEMKVKMEKLDAMIPDVISKAILSYIKGYYELGEDKAKLALDHVVGKINEAVK